MNAKKSSKSRPSRADILSLLEQAGRPLKQRAIADGMGLPAERKQDLSRVLESMLRDGAVIRTRKGAYGLPKKMDLIQGRVSAHPDGYGFLMPDDGGDDLFLSPRQMRQVLHRDLVLGSIVKRDARGRLEGAIVEVLERANETLVGRFVEDSGVSMVVPDDPRINQDVLIPSRETSGARPGQVVVAEILRQPDGRKAPLGRVREILGRAGAPGMATRIAIHNANIPVDWPAEALAQAEGFGDEVTAAQKSGRKDLTGMPLVTIDGADARDFDDAVYAKRSGKGWRLVVAIADVASYVRPGDDLDREAYHRGTSVYFPNQVVPMLPEHLSNGLCSLKPGTDRLCLVCDMRVTEAGKVSRARFYPATMHSQARLTYDQVWAWHDRGEDRGIPERADVRESLSDLFDLYRTLRKARLRRGAIDFDSTEVGFVFNEQGEVADIVPRSRNDAHKLIEECMILANVETARFLLRQDTPGMYRVHEPPQAQKLESLTAFLQQQGIKVPWRAQPEPRHFEQIVEQIEGREDRDLIMAVLLRAQSLAVYQEENRGHFGLALEAYTHFTSPIRRYPDLLVHRAIHHNVAQGKKDRFAYDEDTMNRLADHCSMTERRAEEASREVDERLKCAYMESKVGEVFEGLVSGVTSFGLFVELQRNHVSGLVHVSNLANDYYHFDPVNHQLTGERSGRSFRLADKVQVRVTRVDIEERKIDFELVDDDT